MGKQPVIPAGKKRRKEDDDSLGITSPNPVQNVLLPDYRCQNRQLEAQPKVTGPDLRSDWDKREKDAD